MCYVEQHRRVARERRCPAVSGTKLQRRYVIMTQRRCNWDSKFFYLRIILNLLCSMAITYIPTGRVKILSTPE